MNWFSQNVDPFIRTPSETFDTLTGGQGYTPGDGWGLFKDTMERGPDKAWGDFNEGNVDDGAAGSLLDSIQSFISNPRSVFSGAESKIDELKTNLASALTQERVEREVSSMAPRGAFFGGMAGPPSISGRTFADYMSDPLIKNLASSGIIAQNAAIGRENRDRRTQMMRDIKGENSSHREYQRVAGDVQDRHRDDTLAINRDLRSSQSAAQQAVNDAAMELGLVGMSDEKARDSVHREGQQTNNDIAQQNAASNDMMAQLGENGQDALASMAQAEAKGNAENVRSIRDHAIDEVSLNRGQAADNWGKLDALQASYASEAMQRDLAMQQLGMQRWQAMNSAAQGWDQNDINRTNAEAQMAAATAKASGAGGMDPSDQAAYWRMLMDPSGKSVEGTDGEGRVVNQAEQVFQSMPYEVLEQAVAQGYAPPYLLSMHPANMEKAKIKEVDTSKKDNPWYDPLGYGGKFLDMF